MNGVWLGLPTLFLHFITIIICLVVMKPAAILHEIGHFVTGKILGIPIKGIVSYKDKTTEGMAVIVDFHGITPTKYFAIVASGIVLSFALSGMLVLMTNNLLSAYARFILFINFANLLPIGLFDGNRLLSMVTIPIFLRNKVTYYLLKIGVILSIVGIGTYVFGLVGGILILFLAIKELLVVIVGLVGVAQRARRDNISSAEYFRLHAAPIDEMNLITTSNKYMPVYVIFVFCCIAMLLLVRKQVPLLEEYYWYVYHWVDYFLPQG